jgi:uncharacterized membrane protein YebE (DUF533 family)
MILDDEESTTPLITPHQMKLLRAVTAMAWADGQLEPGEAELLVESLAALFGHLPQESLKVQLRQFIQQNIPLEETVPKIETLEDKKLLVQLSYLVARSSRRTEDEPWINQSESEAYQKVLKMVHLPHQVVNQLEVEAEQVADTLEHNHGEGMKKLVRGILAFFEED